MLKKKRTAKDILTKARVQLCIEKPFFGHLALKMPFIESKDAGCGTTAVTADGKMYYNPEWVEQFTVSDAIFEVGHEVMHLVQKCHDRMPMGADHRTWNLAADVIVDTLLINSGLKASKLSQKAVNDEMRAQFADCKTTEEVYRRLMKMGKNNPAAGGGKVTVGADGVPKTEGDAGTPVRGCVSGACGGNMEDEEKEKWKEHILAAGNIAKMRGDVPGFVEDFLAELLKPTVTWKDHLRTTASTAFKGNYTWSRPSRRSAGLGLRLPSRRPAQQGAVVMMDTSGSISDKELNQFLTECWGIMRECGCPWLKVYFHDVECYHFEAYTPQTITKVKATRGGTSHIDVFEKVEENEDKIGMVVAFTDLYTNFPDMKPKFPVVWAHPEGNGDECKVPWGKKVTVQLWDE